VTRTIAIGLDGVSWNVLEPLLETGRLPNLQALRDEGAYGVLESTIPFFTGPAWSSFATGASPAAHGIYDFMMLRDGGRLSVARQSDLRRAPYYQQLGREGRSSVLINLPLDQDGADGTVIVNSWLTDDDARRILPVGRRDRYRRLLDAYRTFPVNPRDVEELLAIEQARFDLARELFLGERWDHFFVLFSSTDWFGHGHTGHVLRGDPDAVAAALRLYGMLDGYIGWFREHAPDAHVAVLSDHGQCEEKAIFRVNAVLGELGLTTVVDPQTRSDNPFFVSRRPGPRATVRVPGSISRLRTNPLVRPVALLAKRSLRRGLGVQLAAPKRVVDRATSRAFSPTDASFAVYTRDLEDGEVERIRDALLAARLEDGRAAVDDVWTVEELYGRPAEPGGPTLLFSPAVGVRPTTAVRERVVDFPIGDGLGCHQRDGVILVGGPRVAAGDIGRASICDLAPTLLWATGAGVPSDGDGRVLFEAFDAEFAAEQPFNEVEALEVEQSPFQEDDESGEVTRRLKALGYI
jgi:predicted AlkP superfamily phosphohydrolase/phosphomutase